MKRNSYFIILLLIGAVFTSCSKSDIEYENDFDKSYDSWQRFKAAYNNSYSYTIASGSFTGFSSETTLIVKEGRVIKRSYEAKGVGFCTSEIKVYEKWEEETDSLNTHSNGFDPITLDEIYQKAKNEWLVKRKDAKIYFETKNNGMISSCGYIEDGCQDDCFRGITITSIEKL